MYFFLDSPKEDGERGINMVDLMMWLVIAALLLASAIQGIGYYQQAAYVYRMNEAISSAANRIMALATNNGTVDPGDADAVVADINAATPDDGITLSVETVSLTAAGEAGRADLGFELASAVTSTTVAAGDTFYLRATSTAVSKSDVVYFFKDTSSQKNGIHLVNKGQNGTGSAGVAAPTPTATATPTPTPSTTTTAPAPTATPTPTPSATTPAPVNNFAVLNWNTQSSGGGDWRDFAASVDGTTVYGVRFSDTVYKSTDGGVTWASLTSTSVGNRRAIATSGDGKIVLIAKDGGNPFISKDGGATWAVAVKSDGTAVPTSSAWYVSMSQDATKMMVWSYDGWIFQSLNSGATWSQQGSPEQPVGADIASSDNGNVLVGGTYNQRLQFSKNAGSSWTVVPSTVVPVGIWFGVDVSPDGTRMIAVDNSSTGSVWISNDAGSTWTKNTTIPGASSGSWRNATISSDGSKIVVVRSPGYIYTSTDGGATWKENTAQGSDTWRALVDSGDASRIYVGGLAGKMVRGQYAPQ